MSEESDVDLDMEGVVEVNLMFSIQFGTRSFLNSLHPDFFSRSTHNKQNFTMLQSTNFNIEPFEIPILDLMIFLNNRVQYQTQTKTTQVKNQAF